MVHSSNENNAKIKKKNSSVVILSLFYTATEYVQTQRLRHIFIFLPKYCYFLRFIKLCFSQTNISSWTKYINLIRKTAFFKLHHISTMWHYLIALVGSLVGLRFQIDRSNSLSAVLPQSSISRPQRVQNCSACLVVRASFNAHTAPTSRQLYQLITKGHFTKLLASASTSFFFLS